MKLNRKTDRQEKYESWIANVRNMLDGKDEKDQRRAVAANQQFSRGIGLPTESHESVSRAVTPGSVHVDTLLSTVSVMYANGDYIGEQILPPVPVSKRSDKYAIYPKRERLAYPDDELGYRSQANELNQTRKFDNYSVDDYGFMSHLDMESVINQDAPLNEMLDLVEQINEGIAFRREKRIAPMITTASHYAGNTAAASTVWNTATTGGTIIADILGATSAQWRGFGPTRNIGVTTLAAWNGGIVNNPAIKGLFSNVREGLATKEAVARYFNLDDILVAEPREDTANEGQTASYGRIWSTNFFAVLRVAARPTTRSAHFGSTFRMNGDPTTTEWMDPAIGKRGGLYSRVAVSEDHKIIAGDTGFLITTVIS